MHIWQANDPPRVSIRINQKNDCECKNKVAGINCFVRTTPVEDAEAVAHKKQVRIIEVYLAVQQALNALGQQLRTMHKRQETTGNYGCPEWGGGKNRGGIGTGQRAAHSPGVAFVRQPCTSLAQASSNRRASPVASLAGSDRTWRKLRAPGKPAMMPSMWRVMLFSFRPRAPCWAICASI